MSAQHESSELTGQSYRDAPPRGSVYVEVRVEKRIALSRIVEHWTKEEAAALVRGEAGPREALLDEATRLALLEPDEIDLDVSQISITAEATSSG